MPCCRFPDDVLRPHVWSGRSLEGASAVCTPARLPGVTPHAHCHPVPTVLATTAPALLLPLSPSFPSSIHFILSPMKQILLVQLHFPSGKPAHREVKEPAQSHPAKGEQRWNSNPHPPDSKATRSLQAPGRWEAVLGAQATDCCPRAADRPPSQGRESG